MLSPEVRPASRAACVERRPGHQGFDPLVDVAEPLLEPHDGLAVGGEAEMAGLDDAGMDRADRNLVQALAFARQERVGRAPRPQRPAATASGWREAPAAMVEPGPRVGQADGGEPEQILDRALRAGCAGACRRPTEGKRPVGTGQRRDRDVARRLVEQRHMHGGTLAPQAEQGPASRGERRRKRLPVIAVDLDALPRPVLRHAPSAGERVGES